jgi:MFS family permease
VAHALIALGWILFLHVEGRWLLMLPVIYFLQGVASGCWTSANLNYLAKLLPEEERALPVSIHGAVITFIGGCSPVIWGLFMKTEGSSNPVNVPVFELFFVSLVVVCLALLVWLTRLPEKVGGGGAMLQGGWTLRPFRSVANVITLVEKTPGQVGTPKAP